MKKYLDVNGVTSLYKIIMGKVDDKLDEKLQLLLTPSTRPLTFEVLENGTFSFITNGTPTGSVSYSLDSGTTWTALSAGSSTPTIPAGSKVLWKGDYEGTSSSNYGKFSSTGKFNVSGNVMSLTYGDDFKDKTDLTGTNYIFCRLFEGCSKLMDVSDLILPATTLAKGCYNGIFKNCSSLTTVPELPAMTLAEDCYAYMFESCTSLKATPELPATELAKTCYRGMFYLCSSLVTPPVLPIMVLAESCYAYMFQGCTSLIVAPELPATTLADWCYAYMFYNCTSLTTAPELPAMTLANHCYKQMFENCTSLTAAPELPATTLAKNCYQYMFLRCTSLTSAPKVLPATVLTEHCYDCMLSECNSLTTAPEILATTLAPYCCVNMFYSCPSLVTVPKILPATTLASYCYQYMFEECPSLTAAPELPATELVDGCYSYMFHGCPALTTAPELPATVLAKSCYEYMFADCPNLNYIKALFTTDPSTGSYTSNWVSGVSSTGTFIKNVDAKWNATGNNGVPTGWNVEREFDGLTFTALDNTTFSFSKDGLSYSLDNQSTWTTLSAGGSTPTVAAGSKIFWKGSYKATSDSDFGIFSSTGKFNVSGNIMSLTYGDDFKDKTDLTGLDWCFCGLFMQCMVVDASNLVLPATTLANYCYYGMFTYDACLKTSPELPATTLATGCYGGMFMICTSLKTAPVLPATALADSCYFGMFQTCPSLTTAPELPATTLAPSCYSGMFSDCPSLTTAPELPATTLVSSCYSSMFSGCSKLNYIKALFTTTPGSTYTSNWVSGVASTGTFIKNVDATWDVVGVNGVPTGWNNEYNPTDQYLTFEALEDGTFSFSKDGLSYSLDNGTSWTTLSTGSSTPTITAGSKVLWKGSYKGTSDSDYGSFSSTGDFDVSGNIMSLMYGDDFKDKTDLTGLNYCFCKLFYSCMYLTDASDLVLPATTLADHCYDGMFSVCVKLTATPALPATKLAPSCYYSMFGGCWYLTTAPQILPATKLASSCYSSMFDGCWYLIAAPELPATELVSGCYTHMFDQCLKLNYIKAMFTTKPSSTYTDSWVDGVSSTGTFVKNSKATWNVTGNNGVPTGWVVEYAPDMSEQYLTFKALEDGAFSFSKTGTPTGSVSYSLDNGSSWNALNYGDSTPTVTAGSKVLWKGSYKGTSESNYGKFVSTGKFNVSGNVMSLTYGDDFKDKTDLTGSDYCFYGLFYGCPNLIDALSLILPATTLADDCYNSMFKECTSLTLAPELPATTLAKSCYYNMFYKCTSLTLAPELPATTLAGGCYTSMFYKCTSLTLAPELPATTLATGCYSNMFRNCTSLKTAPELPAMTLATYCYGYMFSDCPSLTTAPELPATTLADYCYQYMFQNCSKLNYIKALFTTDLSTGSYTPNWVSGVSSTGKFVKNAAATWNVTGTSGIPSGWTVETA